jgi:pyruvate/2-oxoglutarate dehydrogenase complex dihydrolipoamide acyltransferase (E2) component
MHEIKISQLGEGLVEVHIVTLLKKVGDTVAKDEPLLEVETDKAVMSIESSVEGRLTQWLVEVGESAVVGATVALVEPVTIASAPPLSAPPLSAPPLSAANDSTSSFSVEPVRKVTRNGAISPREKARRRQMDALVPAPTEPEKLEIEKLEKEKEGPLSSSENTRWELSPRQARLGQLLLDSERYMSQAWISMPVVWDDLVQVARELRGLEGLQYRPTPLELTAWCMVQAMGSHPKFRLLNLGEKGYELQKEAALGLSVALPDDELGLAGVVNASTLGLAQFITTLRSNVGKASQGHIQPGRYPVVITYMANYGVQLAVPRLTLPGVSTLFIGAPFEVPTKTVNGDLQWQRTSNFVLAFDHRVINGAGAANFLKDVKTRLQKLDSETTGKTV